MKGNTLGLIIGIMFLVVVILTNVNNVNAYSSSSLETYSLQSMSKYTTTAGSYDSNFYNSNAIAQVFRVGEFGENRDFNLSKISVILTYGSDEVETPRRDMDLIISIKATSSGNPTGNDLVNVTIPNIREM